MIATSVYSFQTLYGNLNPTLHFQQNNQGFTRTQDYQSTIYQTSYYHFEFWFKGNDTYACIHTTHNPASNVNLIKLLQSRFSHVQKRLTSVLGRTITIIPLQGLSGGAAPNETHTLNIKCSNTSSNDNADLMYQLFRYTIDYPI